MTQNEFNEQYKPYVKDGVNYYATYSCDDIIPIMSGDNIVDYEIVNYKFLKTGKQNYEDMMRQQILPQKPTKIEVLEQKVLDIEQSQLVQDMLIDDIVFEVIPTLESQINVNNIKPNEIGEILLNNKNKKENGVNAMAAYLAQKIIEGRDYATVFKTKTYRQYQDEVDTILELEGRGDLIKRSYI